MVDQALERMAVALDERIAELLEIIGVPPSLAAGTGLFQVLDQIYRDFHPLLPYDRIGFALIENEDTVKALWAKSDYPELRLTVGYAAPLTGSTLQDVAATRRPRIINDLERYLHDHPWSESTALVVDEGVRSSLTCPLIVQQRVLGFLFFSSTERNTYDSVHVEVFVRIAEQLALLLEKTLLISRLTETARAVQQQNIELQQLNDLKNHFVGMAAHDLRGPLGQIRWASDLVLEESAELPLSDQQTYLNMIHRLSTHMRSLLDNILDISLIEAGKLELRHTPIEIAEQLREAILDYSYAAEKKGITLREKQIEPHHLLADATRIRQVIDNLISNAVKYSPLGSEVHISGAANEAHYLVSVRDFGPGIRSDERALLFKSFQRLSAKPSGGEKSTGLGLAIARRIVEAHGGAIGVETPVDGGSLFWFTLPVASPHT